MIKMNTMLTWPIILVNYSLWAPQHLHVFYDFVPVGNFLNISLVLFNLQSVPRVAWGGDAPQYFTMWIMARGRCRKLVLFVTNNLWGELFLQWQSLLDKLNHFKVKVIRVRGLSLISSPNDRAKLCLSYEDQDSKIGRSYFYPPPSFEVVFLRVWLWTTCMEILRPTPDHRISLWGNGPEICILVRFLCGSHVPQILEAPS